jgi:hypothetical protein
VKELIENSINMKSFASTIPAVEQPWYADDAGAGGNFSLCHDTTWNPVLKQQHSQTLASESPQGITTWADALAKRMPFLLGSLRRLKLGRKRWLT